MWLSHLSEFGLCFREFESDLGRHGCPDIRTVAVSVPVPLRDLFIARKAEIAEFLDQFVGAVHGFFVLVARIVPGKNFELPLPKYGAIGGNTRFFCPFACRHQGR